MFTEWSDKTMDMSKVIEQMVESKDVKRIRELFNQNYPIDIALGLEEVTDEVLKNFMYTISNTRLASILEVSDPELQIRMLEKLPFRRVGLLFQQMSNDDVVDILGNLPIGIRKKYLNMMKGSSQDEIQTMLKYPQDSAGGIMTTEFISVKEHLTVEETLTKLREISPNSAGFGSLRNCASVSLYLCGMGIRWFTSLALDQEHANSLIRPSVYRGSWSLL